MTKSFLVLETLYRQVAEMDLEDVPPSPQMLDRVTVLLRDAGQLLPSSLPEGILYPNGEGGIDGVWKVGARSIRLSFHPSRPEYDYLYHQEGSGSGADYALVTNITAPVLAEWFRWLCGAAVSKP